MNTFLQDLRYAARSLRKRPGFTAVAVLTLALGIGATTVIFTLVNALLFRPLPVEAPERLETIQEISASGLALTDAYSYPHYLEYREQTDVFSGLAAWGFRMVAVRAGDRVDVVQGTYVTGNYFEVLGIGAARGRLFSFGLDAPPGSHPVVVVSHDFWQRMGADASLIGETIQVNSQPLTVVGVAPEGFGGLMRGLASALWVPIPMYPRLHPGSHIYAPGRLMWLNMVGRRAPGISPERAEAELSALASRITHDHVRQETGIRAAQLAPVTGLPPNVRGPVNGFMMLLLATAGLVLLIAAVNVAGTLLARAVERRREIAIRTAVGAGRGRLVRQLLTESLLLALPGGAGGVLLAAWVAGLIPAFLPASLPFNVALDLGLNARVLGFAAAVTVLTGIAFGLVPALRASRTDVEAVLKGSAPGRGGRGSRLRGAFIVGQVATTVVLLITAGLFVRTLHKTLGAELGFDPDGITIAALDLEPHGYSEAEGRAFFDRLASRLDATPGVHSVVLARRVPLGMTRMRTTVRMDDPAAAPDAPWHATDYNIITSDYFRTMGIALMAGRTFRPSDRDGGPGVAIINRSMASRYWPGEDAIGKRFYRGGQPLRVVGIIENIKHGAVTDEPRPFFYVPFAQNYESFMYLIVRSERGAEALVPAIRRELRPLNRNIPLALAMPLREMIKTSLLPQRMAATIIGTFAVVGLLLAAIGVYGIIAYAVARRTREIGIRRALGAGTQSIIRLVVRRGAVLIGIGIGLGLTAAFAVTRLISSLLYGVSAADPLTFAAVGAILALTGLLAAWVPARRAMKVDPVAALRAE